MPSFRTHDVLTAFAAFPAAYAVYAVSGSGIGAVAFLTGFILGGCLIGPDLDTRSKQYSRWGILRLIWFPYRIFFKHRSRWTHGLLLGAVIRLIYLTGIFSIALLLVGVCVKGAASGDPWAAVADLRTGWRSAGEFVGQYSIVSLMFMYSVGVLAPLGISNLSLQMAE